MKIKLIAAGLFLLTTIGCNAFNLLNPPPTVMAKWGRGNVPFYINLGSTVFDAAANAALADWSQYTGRTHLLGIDSTGPSSWSDGRNEIRWGTASENMPSNVLAWTEPNFSWETGQFIETDIEFNPIFKWGSFDGSKGGFSYDINRVLLHEIGHSIGLGHSQNGSIMAQFYDYGVWELSADDIAGAKFIYNTRSVPDTGSTVALASLALLGMAVFKVTAKHK